MANDDPFTAFTDFLGGLFGGGSLAESEPSKYPVWDPTRPATEIKWPSDSPAPGSIRAEVRAATAPRVKFFRDRMEQETLNNSGFKTTVTSQKKPKGWTWTETNETWKGLTTYEKAAAMSLMEADSADPDNAKNALASMINRAHKEKRDLGAHVGTRIYQPTFEPSQERRLDAILKKPAFTALTAWAQSYSDGNEDDPVNGATHFLAHAPVMLALENAEPRKYRSWRGWSGFDAALGDYSNKTFQDNSHSFVAPEGTYSVARTSK